MRTGIANLPLHGGKCPAWLFTHMKALCAAIVEVIIEDAGSDEVLKRLSDPYWFQALGCVVGFDWHSSGVTTTVCGALKEGLAEIGPRAGIFFAGGKGRVARNTPQEIEALLDRYPVKQTADKLIYASKMSAKVDSSAVQDGYQIYHHFFVFSSGGEWAVVQQGMNEDIKQARRYHWLGSGVEDFTEEPQAAICCDNKTETLNFVARDNKDVRNTTVGLAQTNPEKIIKELKTIDEKLPALSLPRQHSIPRTGYLNKSLHAAWDRQPQNFEELLQIPGIGPGTLRALGLVAEVAYGVKPSFADPVRYSFAHGGKDGFPFPVNERDIENSYATLQRALRKARTGKKEQLEALKKLAYWHSQTVTIKSTPEIG
ncbi:MAG: DUF763 domain-containing protein [Syntrophomonas sp.]